LDTTKENEIVENQQDDSDNKSINGNTDLIAELIEEYIEKFMEKDFWIAVRYCYKWNMTNDIKFNIKEPSDFIFELLELILAGKRKVYIDSYDKFKGSIYYHLKNTMLTYFKCDKKYDEGENKNREESLEGNENDGDENYKKMYDNGNYVDAEDAIFNDLENEELRERLFSLFNENNDKEVEEILVLDLILKGYSREEISKELGLSVDQVTNIRKRIDRRILKNKNKIFY